MTLEASARTALGRRAKTVTKENLIPAVMYGHGVETRTISIPFQTFRKVFAQAGTSSLVDIVVDGASPVKAIIKEVQVNPLTMSPTHIDFHQVNMKEKMTADVPLSFTGDSIAVKALGGTLMKSLDHVEVECLPADLPHEIVVDISKLNTFDDKITVGGLVLPKGVEVTNELTAMIAFVEAPLTEDELKKLEESQVGDVTAVKSEADLKKEADAAAAAATEANAKA